MLDVSILGTGHFVPEKILTNDDLSKMVDTNDEWITQRTGIKERRIAEPGVACSDLSTEASKKALQAAGITAEEIDYIILGTVSGDHQFPSTACIVQKKLGAKNAAAFDISAACSGLVYGMKIAIGLLQSKPGTTALVIGAEVLSSIVDWKDRNTCVIFGDGAGAVVLRSSEEGTCESKILSSNIYSDGNGYDMLWLPVGQSATPLTDDNFNKREEGKSRQDKINMLGKEVYKFAVKGFSSLITDILKNHNLKPEEIDVIVPHQVNKRIVDAFVERSGISADKVFLNLEKYGNTSAASVGIALSEAVLEGVIKKGQLVLLIAFGGGLTWASVLVRW